MFVEMGLFKKENMEQILSSKNILFLRRVLKELPPLKVYSFSYKKFNDWNIQDTSWYQF